MRAADVLRRLRLFLLLLALFLFAGTMFELWLVQHYQDFIQMLAFILGGIGLLGVLVALLRPTRPVHRIWRWCMFVVILGSAFGIYQHVANNIGFALEIQPNLSARELWMKGLRGANPLLAPATFAVGALIALAATYKQSVTDDL